jgi:hypothetical protein
MNRPIDSSSHQPVLEIRALIFRDLEHDLWIAQGLEYDICVQAKTVDEAHDAFERTLAATALVSLSEGRAPFEGIERAPRRFWDDFERASARPDLENHRSLENLQSHLIPTFSPRFRVAEKLTA